MTNHGARQNAAARLLATEVLAGLKKIDLTGIDFAQAKRLTRQALTAADAHRLGYAIVCATIRRPIGWWIRLAVSPSVVRGAIRYAVVVGLVLITINHRDAIV